eukprot:2442031-Pleurochrysis_carterae.AAC.7
MLGAFRVCFETSAACRSDIAAGSSSTGRASTAPSGGVRCSSGSLTARDASDARAFSRLTRSCSYLRTATAHRLCLHAVVLLGMRQAPLVAPVALLLRVRELTEAHAGAKGSSAVMQSQAYERDHKEQRTRPRISDWNAVRRRQWRGATAEKRGSTEARSVGAPSHL